MVAYKILESTLRDAICYKNYTIRINTRIAGVAVAAGAWADAGAGGAAAACPPL